MILQQLREATRADHQQLEARIDLLGRDWSMQFYRALLEKFAGFYAIIEPEIFKFPQWQTLNFAVETRRKMNWLQSDLRFLGLDDAEIDALPRCKYLQRIESFAQALGCAYVVEGSTLGGQIIARHLKMRLDLPTEGLKFFTAYGAQTGAKWREFIAVLGKFEGSETEKHELVASGGATFRALECWLDEII